MPARLRHRIEVRQITAVGRPTKRSPVQADSRALKAIDAAIHAHEVLRYNYL